MKWSDILLLHRLCPKKCSWNTWKTTTGFDFYRLRYSEFYSDYEYEINNVYIVVQNDLENDDYKNRKNILFSQKSYFVIT